MRQRVLAVVIAVIATVAAGCDWPIFRNGPERTGATSDPSITKAAVSSLGLRTDWTAPLVDDHSSPTVASGRLYIGLKAFDAAGMTGCSGVPKQCQALWTEQLLPGDDIFNASPTIANGVLYIGSFASGGGRLYAFDASGVTNCSGSPKTCLPLWTAATGSYIITSPAIVNGIAYVTSTDGRLSAFRAQGCGSSSCSPLWTATTGAAIDASPAVANGVVYVASDRLYSFDASGVTNCSGAPKVCSPLWTAMTGGGIDASPAVADGRVFVGSQNDNVYAFDAAGGSATCSGAPKVCSPLWIAATRGRIDASPAVANGDVYVASTDGHLYAFDAAGVTNCSTGVCQPVWTGTPHDQIESSPTVAGGVVYVGSGGPTDQLDAFDAAGFTNCTGASPGRTCQPIWTAQLDGGMVTEPAIANGLVYAAAGSALLYAFRLPWGSLGPNPIVNRTGGYPSSVGRIDALDAAPSSGTLYAGSDGGGVWRSSDGGNTWSPLTDSVPAPGAGIRSLRVDPTNNQTIYAGFEAERNVGAGLYQSLDGGTTWQQVGASALGAQEISAIRVDPSNRSCSTQACYVYAALVQWGFNSYRIGSAGVAVSSDNGQTWTDPTATALAGKSVSDLDIATNGDVYAAVPGSGVYRSVDHGSSWQNVGNLASASGDVLKLALAPSTKANSTTTRVLYVERGVDCPGCNPGKPLQGVYRSTNGGGTWTNIADTHISGQGTNDLYSDYVAVDAQNPAIVFVGLVDLWKSSNGTGSSPTWADVSGGGKIHVDQRSFVQTPAGRFFGGDGGIYVSSNGESTFAPAIGNLDVTEFNDGSVGDSGFLAGATQDNGLEVTTGSVMWSQTEGGDGFAIVIDPQNNENVYATQPACCGDTQFSTNGGASWQLSLGISGDNGGFSNPLAVDPTNQNIVYEGRAHLWHTANGSWVMGGRPANFVANFARLAVAPGPVVFALDTAGNAAVSTDAGASWTSRASLPCFGCDITGVSVDQQSGNVVFVTALSYPGSPQGHVYRSTNRGASWTELTTGLAPAHAILIDPTTPTKVYVGTDHGLYVSVDQGAHWSVFGPGLPNVEITAIVQHANAGLTVFTYGRGAWRLQT